MRKVKIALISYPIKSTVCMESNKLLFYPVHNYLFLEMFNLCFVYYANTTLEAKRFYNSEHFQPLTIQYNLKFVINHLSERKYWRSDDKCPSYI